MAVPLSNNVERTRDTSLMYSEPPYSEFKVGKKMAKKLLHLEKKDPGLKCRNWTLSICTWCVDLCTICALMHKPSRHLGFAIGTVERIGGISIGRTLWTILKNQGFRFMVRKNHLHVLERKEIVAWRNHYLRAVKEKRKEGRIFVYCDETWCNQGYTTPFAWYDNFVQENPFEPMKMGDLCL